MNSNFSHLLSPLKVGSHVYKNRLEIAPMGGIGVDPDGQLMRDFVIPGIDARGDCGGAAFIVGETAVSDIGGRDVNPCCRFSEPTEARLAPYAEVAEHIHTVLGCKALIELFHCGEAKDPKDINPAWGPDDYVKDNGVHVHGMTKADIEVTRKEFVDAAWFMKQAGFEGVVLHAGHGWLFTQFLSPRTNHRTDEYGGSVENRSRFSVEVARAIKERCGDDFILEARISGSEHAEGGYSVEDVCAYSKYISEYVDIIHVSAGLYRDPMRTLQESTLYDAHGCNVEIAAAIKKVVSIPVSVVGGINSPEQAEELIASGKVDMVALGRQLKADKNWLRKAENGHPEEIRRCLRCMRCFPGPFEEAMRELNGVFPVGCSINPYDQHPEALNPQKAKNAKNVLIVGGGPAGLQCAITAAERGHHVVIAEKSERVGGVINYAEVEADKYDLFQLARTLEATARNRGVEIRTNTECTGELLDEIKPDSVVLAIGTSALVPRIPGIDAPEVLEATTALAEEAQLKSPIVVLGGGLVGCESAVSFMKAGKQVTVVEMRDSLAPDAYRLHRHKLLDLLKDTVDCRTGTTCLAITENGVSVRDSSGEEQLIPAATVVNALGRRSNPKDEIIKVCAERGLECLQVGDCVTPRKLYDAIEEGCMTAMKL